MTAISAGKLRSLRRLADADGHFSMVAVDQRPSIMGRIEAARGSTEDAEIAAVKRTLLAALAPSASAVLCDPIWSYPFGHDLVSPAQGLIVTLEDHRFAEEPGGRRTRAIQGWSVEKIKRLGADGVKVLAHYRPDAAPEVVAHQQAFVRLVGSECRRCDLPFVLELLLYPLAGDDPDPLADPTRRAELVVASVRRFTDPAFGVDLFKLESPVPPGTLPEADADGAEATQAPFDEVGRAAAGRPWVLLSAGASAEAFKRALTFAARAGASGFLAGRAIWWQAFEHYPDLAAMGAALEAESVPYMRQLTAITAAHGRPWHVGPPALADAGFDFPRRYGGLA